MLFTTNGMFAKSNTQLYVARTSNNRVISSVDPLLLAATVWSFAHLPLQLFNCSTRNTLLVFRMPNTWKWIGPYLAYPCRHITSPFHKFNTTFNSGLQLPTRWDTFAPATVLRCPEPTMERAEPTILSIIAIRIIHLIRFTLLFLLRRQRFMWRDQFATWAYANNDGRNLVESETPKIVIRVETLTRVKLSLFQPPHAGPGWPHCLQRLMKKNEHKICSSKST